MELKACIGIIGYGKMGRMIHKVAQKDGCVVSAIVTRDKAITQEALDDCDVLIEFTNAGAAPTLIETALTLQKPIVSGTTGFDIAPLQYLSETIGTPFFHAPNFSMGIYRFYRLCKEAGKLLNDYDVAGHEVHHAQKKDSPSGTAKLLASAFGDKQVAFSSMRLGNIVGTHTILFDSPFDTIELTHRAKNREGYAHGALTAAQWLIGKKGFHTMEDMFETRDLYGAHHTI